MHLFLFQLDGKGYLKVKQTYASLFIFAVAFLFYYEKVI